MMVLVLSVVLLMSITKIIILYSENRGLKKLTKEYEKVIVTANKVSFENDLLEKDIENLRLVLNNKIEEFRNHNKVLNKKVICLKREIRKLNQEI